MDGGGFTDAAKAHLTGRQSAQQTPRASFRTSGIVPVKNASGSGRARFDALGINGPLFWPHSDLDAFKNHPAFLGQVPSSIDPLGHFAILLEPALSGAPKMGSGLEVLIFGEVLSGCG